VFRRTAAEKYSASIQCGNIMTEPTLYKRLGSYDTISAIADDFLARLIAHPQMQRFFLGAAKRMKLWPW